jgi:prephenate dehydratase
MLKQIYFLGPHGTFSELATKMAIPFLSAIEGDSVALPCKTIQEVADQVRRPTPAQQLGCGVVPYYNLLEGLVQESIDSIAASSLKIVGLLRLPIVFCTALPPGTSPSSITEVVSHPKALAQCSEFLRQTFPHAGQTPVASTAEGVRLAAESTHIAVVASRAAIEPSTLVVLADDVGNRRHGTANFTDFFCVVAPDRLELFRGIADGSDRSIVSITPHTDTPGLLSAILALFSLYRINLAKIHSRPSTAEVPTGGCPQTFYLEAEIGPHDPGLASCISTLCCAFRQGHGDAVILGGFRAPG